MYGGINLPRADVQHRHHELDFVGEAGRSIGQAERLGNIANLHYRWHEFLDLVGIEFGVWRLRKQGRGLKA